MVTDHHIAVLNSIQRKKLTISVQEFMWNKGMKKFRYIRK
jgi:hypothetical protein